MDFKKLLASFDELVQINEETGKYEKTKTATGTQYTRKYDPDTGETDTDTSSTAPAKQGRGRPKKAGNDDSKKYSGAKDLQDYIVGNVPKDSKELKKLPKKKHSLKEYFDALDEALTEEDQVTIQPADQKTQVIKQGDKTLGTVDNPQLAQQIKQSIGSGEMSLAGDELGEGEGSGLDNILAKHGDAVEHFKQGGELDHDLESDLWDYYFNKGDIRNYDADASEYIAQQLADELGVNEQQINPDVPFKLNSNPKTVILTLKDMGLEPEVRQFMAWARDSGFLSVKDAMDHATTVDWEEFEDEPGIDRIVDGWFRTQELLGYDGESNRGVAESVKSDKKVVKEGINRLQAAHHSGKSHALAGHSYSKPEDVEEARMYHEGYKAGLDECYGEPMMGEGNAFTAALAQTDKGDEFKVGGKSFTDTSNYDSSVDETVMAFESWDKQLQDAINEGTSISINKGQQGMGPGQGGDSVSVTATDADADKLLALIKNADLGVFGDDSEAGEPEMGKYGAPMSGEVMTVSTDDSHDVPSSEGPNMMDMLKKMADIDGPSQDHDADFKDEHGEDSEEVCDHCGKAPCECDHDEHEAVHEEHDSACEECGKDPCECDHEGHEHDDACEECGKDPCECEEEQVDESYANEPDEEMMKLKSLLKMGNDMHHEKKGQSTGNVVRAELDDWKKLSGM